MRRELLLDQETFRRGPQEEREVFSTRSQGSSGADSSLQRRPALEQQLPRELHGRVRNRDFQLDRDQAQTTYVIGKFRVINVDDLGRSGLAGRDPEHVLRALSRQKLIKRVSLTVPGKTEPLQVVVLTRLGKEVLDRAYSGASAQRFYAGLVKPREVKHDTTLFRMYQAESERLTKAGGRVCRVVLDYEFKREIFSALQKAHQPQAGNPARLREEIAARHGLRVVNGKIPLPDLRIEYVTARGESRHIDLELATGHYKASQRAEKARAGFQIYNLQSHAGGTPHAEDLIREVLVR